MGIKSPKARKGSYPGHTKIAYSKAGRKILTKNGRKYFITKYWQLMRLIG